MTRARERGVRARVERRWDANGEWWVVDVWREPYVLTKVFYRTAGKGSFDQDVAAALAAVEAIREG